MNEAGRTPQTFRGVQALRGLAAALVVSSHATRLWASHTGSGDPGQAWENGVAGVDLFFVISGFVMAVSTAGSPGGGAATRRFLERRLIRIAPLYWLMTTTMLVKEWVATSLPALRNTTEHVSLTPAFLAASYLFVPWRNSFGTAQPLLFVGWTLSFELYFYLLVGFALWCRARLVPMLTPLMLLLAAIGAITQPDQPILSLLSSPMLLEFLAGLLLGRAVLAGRRLPDALSAALGLIGLACLLFARWSDGGAWRALLWGVPALLVVQAVVLLEPRLGDRWPRWSLALGDSSYSLYLLHPLLLPLAYPLLRGLHMLGYGRVRLWDEAATVTACLMIAIPAAEWTYRFLERPMTLWLRRRWLGEPPPAETTQAIS